MIRWLSLGLAIGLTLPALAQDNVRPIAREVVPPLRPQARPVEPTPAPVRPVARTQVQGPLAPETETTSKPAIDIFTQRWQRADITRDVEKPMQGPLLPPVAIIAEPEVDIFTQRWQRADITRDVEKPMQGPLPPPVAVITEPEVDIFTKRWARADISRAAQSVRVETGPAAIRPIVRGSDEARATTLTAAFRPRARPDQVEGVPTDALFLTDQGHFAFNNTAVAQSRRPDLRPASFAAAAQERRAARLRGQVCGDPAIQGEAIGRVNGPGACGIEGAVRVRSVAGVALSPRATIDCQTASALKRWVETGAIPAVGGAEGGVESLRVVSHYACRGRNNQAGARLSEHSFGRAIDIAGIKLKSGREITVLNGWSSASDGARLRHMWRAACGPFGTVLGPNANRFHLDHFHFDTARYRSGSYCR